MIGYYITRLFAASGAQVDCSGSNATVCSTGLPTVSANGSAISFVLQITFGIIAAVAVLIMVIAGLRFVLSEGNPENVSKARQTILYAAVGLVISLVAEGIVSFVLTNL